jgi:hypothetical protein
MAAFGAITEHGRADVIRVVRGALDAYTNDDGLAFPTEAYVVLARK